MGIRMSRAIFAASAAGALASIANAGIVGDAIFVQAISPMGVSQTWAVPTSAGAWDSGTQTWTYSSSGPQELRTSGGTLIGTIGSLSMTAVEDPMLDISLECTAGITDTTFIVSTGLLTFSPLLNPTAVANAGMTLTDLDGNGATLTGGRPGNTVFSAHYNGLIPAGSIYANLQTGFSFATAFDTNSFSDNAFGGILGSVGSMSSRLEFTVSANDSASGGGFYLITPAPGAFALLGLGGLAAARRRR